jgi:hypothetical protein
VAERIRINKELLPKQEKKGMLNEAAEKPLDYRWSINSSNKVDEFSLKS